MENKINSSNLDFLELTNGGKIVATESKIKWLFIRNYTIIALIFFTIYKIIYNIMDQKFINLLNENFAMKIVPSDIINFTDVFVDRAHVIMITSIIILLCNLIIVGISSILILQKYKIKKEYVNNIMKVIVIIELVFFAVLVFDFSVIYINQTSLSDRKYSFETALEKYNANHAQKVEYNIDDYMNKINNANITNLVVTLIINILCTSLCVLGQKKILEKV